jgi:uncharacterized protein
MKIGLISDTHGYFDPKIPKLFAGVEHILHAGDIGRESVIDELRSIAPVTAVLGNVDGDWPGYREVERVTLGGRKFFVVHVGRPRSLTPDLRRRIFQPDKPDMVVFGHTHQPEEVVADGVTFINPGSAGQKRFNLPRCIAIAEIKADGKIETRWLNLDE